MTSFAATRRAHEFGVRLALGATGSGVVRLVLMSSLALLGVAGVAIGVPAALTVTNLVRRRFFGVAPGDPLVLLVTSGVMLLTTVFAGCVPAFRAARLDPARTLRAD